MDYTVLITAIFLVGLLVGPYFIISRSRNSNSNVSSEDKKYLSNDKDSDNNSNIKDASE